MSGAPLTYVLGNKSGIGLYKYTGETLPAFKAYYQPKEVNNAPAFRFSFDDIVDAIHHIENGNADTPIYDLNGRRIMNRCGKTPSIHIQNGKKIIH